MADSRTLLITGASTGIGAATARQAAAAGWNVALGARSEDKLSDLAGELGDNALAQRCDVTNYEDQERLVQAALDRFGRIDAVFANAGFGAARGFQKEDPEQWRSMVLTNVLGVAYTIRATMPHIAADGHYVITSSVAGRRSLRTHALRRGPPLTAGLALLVDEVGGHGNGRVAAPGAAPSRVARARDARRARHGRHPVLRQPPDRRARARRHRPDRHVRARAARAC